jgi:hypothetical protein
MIFWADMWKSAAALALWLVLLSAAWLIANRRRLGGV